MTTTVKGELVLYSIINSVFSSPLYCQIATLLSLPDELREKAFGEIIVGLQIVIKDLAEFIKNDARGKKLLDELPKTLSTSANSKKNIENIRFNNKTQKNLILNNQKAGGKSCVSKKIEELKETNDSFKAAKQQLDNLISDRAPAHEITQAQAILYGIEREIREEAIQLCKSTIMPYIMSGAANIFSNSYILGLSALTSYGVYRITEVPTKIAVETAAVSGNTVGTVVGSVAAGTQSLLNFGMSALSYVGIPKSTIVPFSFADGLGSDFGKKASEAVMDSLKKMGNDDLKIGVAILVFVVMVMLLASFRFCSKSVSDILTVAKKGGEMELSVSLTGVRGKLQGATSPPASQVYSLLRNVSSIPRLSNSSSTSSVHMSTANTPRVLSRRRQSAVIRNPPISTVSITNVNNGGGFKARNTRRNKIYL